jgi:hypothetical protein
VTEEIERATADQTVEDFGPDAIWIAPTERGAVLRASRCLWLGYSPEHVANTLNLRSVI